MKNFIVYTSIKRAIGQKVCVKTDMIVDISTVISV